MGFLDVFWKRKKRQELAGKPDVYRYDQLPTEFRVQVFHILNHSLGEYGEDRWYNPLPSNEYWDQIHEIMLRELGRLSLAGARKNKDACLEFLLLEPDADKVLGFIELSFGVLDVAVRRMEEHYRRISGMDQGVDEAIEELNHRFKEHSIGYQYVGGQIIRVDSEYVHAEVVRPALSLLHDADFTGPEEEFQRAHKHYRDKNYPEAISEAHKAFEGTMKAICNKLKWPYPERATAKDLITTVFGNELISKTLESHFTALRSVLESGLPTVRNRATPSGHTQGATPVKVPEYMAAYALHLAAANIVLLIEAYKAR